MNDLHESFLEVSKELQLKFCVICNEASASFCKIKPCNHEFCEKCIKLYLEYKITNGEVLKILCPYNDCGVIIEDSFISSCISRMLYLKYKSYKKLRLLEKNIHLRWCSRPGCEGYSIGGLKNRKLTCNKCEHNYCYFCGNDWHENKKCSNRIDKEFEKWATSNNTKFCPNCKHRVLRDGGCTEMKCAICQYSWCWNCGVGTKEHNDYHCIMGKNSLELYWITIFILLFSPVLFPFSVFLALVVKNEIFHINYSHVKLWIRICAYIGIFAVSPVLLVLLIFGYFIVLSSQLTLEKIGRRFYIIAVLFGLIIGGLFGVLTFLAAGIMCLVFPPIGIFFFMLKCFFVLKRRCKYEKQWEHYPRTVV